MKAFSHSVVGFAGGILVLGALGTIGFVNALANPQSSPPAFGSRIKQTRTPGSAPMDEAETFVLAQGIGGMGSGAGMESGSMMGMACVSMKGVGPGPNAPKEIVIKWERPTGPIPAWLDTKNSSKPIEDEIRAKLNDRLDLELNGTPLSGAMKAISKQMGIDVLIDDKALEEENVTPDEPITMSRKSARLRDVLMQILEPLQLTYQIDLEAIIITSKKTSANEMRFYDLSSILPDNGLMSELCAGIQAMVNPDHWEMAGGTSAMRTVGSMLVIAAPNETHTAVERFLQEVSKQPSANLKPRAFVEKPASKPAESDKPAQKR